MQTQGVNAKQFAGILRRYLWRAAALVSMLLLAASTHVFAASISTTTTLTTHNPNPSNTGQAVTINFLVQGAEQKYAVSGAVTVNSSDGAHCQGILEYGKPAPGSCVITFTSAGVKSLVATYAGDEYYAPSVSVAAQHTVSAIVAPVVAPTGIPREVPEADTLLLLGGGMSGLGVWLRWQWGKRRQRSN